ncbi:MAG TPA: hypothetical protein PLM07_06575 [Candidatus Rifleibacterium sp.]|nr:hypothetical protein [Candidatus Rifleibacterium sp.]HPT45545.1 hypothetical protein [Candidatus Rifleibacterium sp.]
MSPGEKVRLAVLGNRLNMTRDEADRLLSDLQKEIATILAVPESAVSPDTEFAGRDLDLVFTLNKQNTPNRKK